jgi:hypothetical protein
MEGEGLVANEGSKGGEVEPGGAEACRRVSEQAVR